MKKLNKFTGVIALVAVVLFTVALTTCIDVNLPGGGNSDDGNNGNNQTAGGNGGNNQNPGGSTPPTSAPLGATLNLNGQVYIEIDIGNTISYVPYNGVNLTVSGYIWTGSDYSPIGGSGTIINGQFTFSIGRPNILRNISEEFGWNGIRISNTEAKCSFLNLHTSNNSYLGYNISTYNNYEEVIYLYVDRDVIISADRTVNNLNAFNINLKTGWNAVHQKETVNEITISAANPANLRWVLGGIFDGNGNSGGGHGGAGGAGGGGGGSGGGY